MTPLDLKRGDFVTLRYGLHTVKAMVGLISDNRRSLFVQFSRILCGCVAGMPLLYDNGRYTCIVGGEEIAVEPERVN